MDLESQITHVYFFLFTLKNIQIDYLWSIISL
jgi:hypothetical protein